MHIFMPLVHKNPGPTHNHVDLPPLVSLEATVICIPVGNSEVLLAALYKSPGKPWSDADISELLSFRRNSIFTGKLNAKYPFWNSRFSNPSGEKLMDLFDMNTFEISVPKFPTHYSSALNGDVLDIVDHTNIRVSDVIVFGFESSTNSIPHTGSCQN
jgi:hypothetical protein